MRFLLTSIGTRGDMEPLLATGELLKLRGHEVCCLFPEQFRNIATESGFEFESLGTEFIDMLHSDIGKKAMGGSGSGLAKVFSYVKLAKESKKANKVMIERQIEVIDRLSPDRIIHNPKVIYPTVWGLDKTNRHIQISPVPYLNYTKGHTHLAFNSNWGKVLNKLTYKIAEFGLVKTIMLGMKWNDKMVNKHDIVEELRSTPTLYTISPSLFPRPNDWDKHLQVVGYHERDKTRSWEPSEELLQFIASHAKILFITFGSMTNPRPQKISEDIIKVVTELSIPTIINAAEGGLIKPEKYNSDMIHFVQNIPYDWVFSKMYAVIHHGGSGTTHMALKHGCANMIIPHIIDQFVWNKINAAKGAGPIGFKITKLKRDNFKSKLSQLWNNKTYKEEAKKVQTEMLSEDMTELFYSELVK